jgi:hypothetical protein
VASAPGLGGDGLPFVESRDDGAASPAEAIRLTLRCALARATRDVTGSAVVGSRRVRWGHRLFRRHGGVQRNVCGAATDRLDNRPGTTMREMLSVLEESRARIRGR